MGKYFSAGIIKILLLTIFHLPALSPCKAILLMTQDTLSATDTGKLQVTDSILTEGDDTLKSVTESNDTDPLPDSLIYKRTDFSHEELIRGERLFYGLAYLDERAVNCVICHNTTVSDTMNWNPDAFEISKKYINKSAEDLSRVLLNPLGQKMELVHKDFNLSAEDITLMKAFMDKFSNLSMKQPKPVITNLLLLIFAFILFFVSFTDLIVRKIFKNRRVNLTILLVTGVFICWTLAVNAIAIGRSTDFSPDQPIKFSHAVHAGQNQTDCIYCHYTAETSKTAGIPSGSICYNCHILVRTGTRSGVSEIAKVIEALDSTRTVDWVRLYKLPDYAFFSHATHVSVGEIECEKCHGDVKSMDRLIQVPDLSMGWCINCHETTKVNLANEYYQKYYPEQVKLFHEGKVDSVMIAEIGGKDCMKCHY
jgi:hypothetical protein